MYTLHMRCYVRNHDQLALPLLLNVVDGPKTLNPNRTVNDERAGE